jgi:tight adherence protein C
MLYAILAFSVIFLLIASGGMLLFYREAMLKRISEVINPAPKPKNLLDTLQQTGVSIGGMVEHFEHVLPKSKDEVSAVTQRLIRAGYRDESAIKTFYGSKVILPILFLIAVFITGVESFAPFLVIVLALAAGFLAPDLWLQWMIRRRQTRIRRGLPDVLDLLIICIEAGLSIDQASSRCSEELRKAQPELSDELGVVVLEQRAGRPRADAWKNMSDRTGVDSIRHFVTMLVQSEQFGTSIGKALRVHSDTLRTKRVQQVEEKAAKLSVKLVFPLAIFIFPSLFIVALGPAFISLMDSLKGLTK